MRVRDRSVGWAAGTAMIAWLVYLSTVAPGLTWAHHSGDGGELITAAVTLGIPHPPGYPTYVLLGKLLSLIPGGDMAFRFNLWSAFSAAVAAGFLTSITWTKLLHSGAGPSARNGAVSIATGLSFAFAPLVWAQATVSEVYGLNLAFLGAFLWSLHTSRPPWLTGLILGLSVTTHLTSWFMLPLALYLLPRREWTRLGVGLLAGLTPFLALFVLARGDSPVMWGDASSLSGWWWLVSGRLYRGNVMSLSLPRSWSRFLGWSPMLLGQSALASPVLIVVGLFTAQRKELTRCLALLATAALYLLYAVRYDSVDSIVYLLPGLLLVAFPMAFGLARLGWLAVVLPMLLLLLNFNALDLSEEPSLQPRAEKVLDSAPDQAVLIMPGDETIFALWYMQHVEQMRPDLILVDSNLFAFDWYRARLGRHHETLLGLAEDDLEKFRTLNQQERAFCHVSLSEPPVNDNSEDDCIGAVR